MLLALVIRFLQLLRASNFQNYSLHYKYFISRKLDDHNFDT